MLGPFHLQRVNNKLYQKYKPVMIIQQKEHLLIWNSETTPNLNIYLHNYQTETAIFLATKHGKTIMACNYLNFSKIHQNSKKWWLAFVRNCFVNFCCYEYIIVPMLLQAVQKRRLAQGCCWSYANSLNS